MDIEIKRVRNGEILLISGDIDMYTSPALRRELMGLIGRKAQVVFVDFSGVSYIDSSGIATFVEGLKGMMVYGGKLKLLGIKDNILEIFSFSKLDKVFEIYGSIEDAVNS